MNERMGRLIERMGTTPTFVTFSAWREELQAEFEKETGFSRSSLLAEGMRAVDGIIDYEQAYTTWLEIRLARGTNVIDIPGIPKKEGR